MVKSTIEITERRSGRIKQPKSETAVKQIKWKFVNGSIVIDSIEYITKDTNERK